LHLIYKELEWELLAERRNRRGLQMLYYNQNNNAVSYLCDLIPQKKDQSTTVYSLRNGSDIINIMYNFPYIRSITYDSFIPKAISQ
jgi:hypothetical protein